MISCKLKIYDVTDRDDKKDYFSELEQLTPNSKASKVL